MVSSLSSGITIRRGRPEPSRERRWSGAHRRVGVAREGGLLRVRNAATSRRHPMRSPCTKVSSQK